MFSIPTGRQPGAVRAQNSQVGDTIIQELQHYFAAEGTMTIKDRLATASEVIVADGARRDGGKSPVGDASHAEGANPARRIGWPHLGGGELGSAVLEKNTVADQGAGFGGIPRQRMRIQVEVEGAANNSSSKVNFGGETAGLAES